MSPRKGHREMEWEDEFPGPHERRRKRHNGRGKDVQREPNDEMDDPRFARPPTPRNRRDNRRVGDILYRLENESVVGDSLLDDDVDDYLGAFDYD